MIGRRGFFEKVLGIGRGSCWFDFLEVVFGFEDEGGEGVEVGDVVAGELFDETIELLFEAEEASRLVEGDVDTIEVEAGDLVVD